VLLQDDYYARWTKWMREERLERPVKLFRHGRKTESLLTLGSDERLSSNPNGIPQQNPWDWRSAHPSEFL